MTVQAGGADRVSCRPRQRVAVLGSTGSVGTNTLDVLARHARHYEVFLLAAGSNADLLASQCAQFRPAYAALADVQAAAQLQERLRSLGLTTRVLAGGDALCEQMGDPQLDVVVAAIVGVAGLPSSLAAARAGKRLLLANKETLVVGGHWFMQQVQAGSCVLLPLDSEHSAVLQSLPDDRASWRERVEKIILTASGGPFRQRDPDSLAAVTPQQACAHPNWSMGRKISVDSATMMNKALELIEACYLFDQPPEQIDVVIHPQSVIHSMVEYRDGSIVAQLGTPDMRVPIACALAWPGRMESGAARLDFKTLAGLSFESFDEPLHQRRFPCMGLAREALRGPAGTTAVLNAANEVSVAAFLAGELRFDRIYAVNAQTLAECAPQGTDSLEGLLALDARARAIAARNLRKSLAGS